MASRAWTLHLLIAIVAVAHCPLFAVAQDEPSSSATSESEAEREQLYKDLQSDLEALERQASVLRRVVKVVTPSVVHIEAGSARRTVEEAGGGALIRIGDDIYVLTNRHVIKESTTSTIDIKLADGRRIRPTAIWSDPGTDVGVLKVDAPRLVSARLGDSDKVEIGDFVLAVGSPFGLSHSVTFGIISAKGRRDLQLGDARVRYQDFLQTDAAINPGNSGGPLISLRGEVIGINTAIASNSGGNDGIGFTIPINMAMTVARQLIKKGHVSRAYVGVHLDRDFDAAKSAEQLGLARPVGARVSGITPNSPAAKANLRVDDVIVQLNGKWIEDDDHLISQVSVTAVGESVELTVIRERRPFRVRLSVGDRAKFEPDSER